MSTATIETSNSHRLAKRLEEHIHSSGLGPGDRYLTAAEAGRLLNVSTATAHRVMKGMTERQLLLRHRGRGTFVGPHFVNNRRLKMRTVYALVQSRDKTVVDFPFNLLVQGVRKQIGDANVQLSFVPPHDSIQYVGELIRSARAAGEVAGMVPISCSQEVYRHLARSGLPTVIFGSLYADQQGIASVDVDNRESGRLLTEHLLRQGHRRMVLVSDVEGRPGDNCFFDGVSEALTSAGLPHNSLIVRIMPREAEAFAAQFRQLLEAPDCPSALIARSGRLARAADSAISDMELPAARGVEIVFQDHPPTKGRPLAHTCVRPKLPFEDIAALIGRMLDRLSPGRAARAAKRRRSGRAYDL